MKKNITKLVLTELSFKDCWRFQLYPKVWRKHNYMRTILLCIQQELVQKAV